MKILSRLKIQAKNRDQVIKEFVSLEVVEGIKDDSLRNIVHDLYFKLSENLDWEKVLSVCVD